MQRLSEEAVQKNREIIEKLIEGFHTGRRESVQDMMKDVGLEFYTAPASQREEYHNCFPGGLADHSLRVVKNLRTLAGALAPGKFELSVLNFVGLFHDLGKVGDGDEPYYVPHPSEWHRKQGMLYEINKKCVFMPSAERGLYVLQLYGVTLTSDEYLAIRLNDGMYEETNRKYGMKEPDLALLVHMADRWACTQEKGL